jgi:hypothetical protein
MGLLRVRQVQFDPFHNGRAIEIGEAVGHGFIADRCFEYDRSCACQGRMER